MGLVQIFPRLHDLHDIEVVNSDDVWIVGEGVILHYDGEEVKEIAFPEVAFPKDWLHSISMVDDKEGWIVGWRGSILHYNGRSWKQFPSPTTKNLLSVDTINNYGWAVGEKGTTLHYNGNSWKTFSLFLQNSSSDLNSVSIVSEINGWAVGDYGTILQLDSKGWRQVESPTEEHLHAVIAVDKENAWAVGNDGTVLCFKNGKWKKLSVCTSKGHAISHRLEDITVNNGKILIVGNHA